MNHLHFAKESKNIKRKLPCPIRLFINKAIFHPDRNIYRCFLQQGNGSDSSNDTDTTEVVSSAGSHRRRLGASLARRRRRDGNTSASGDGRAAGLTRLADGGDASCGLATTRAVEAHGDGGLASLGRRVDGDGLGGGHTVAALLAVAVTRRQSENAGAGRARRVVVDAGGGDGGLGCLGMFTVSRAPGGGLDDGLGGLTSRAVSDGGSAGSHSVDLGGGVGGGVSGLSAAGGVPDTSGGCRSLAASAGGDGTSGSGSSALTFGCSGGGLALSGSGAAGTLAGSGGGGSGLAAFTLESTNSFRADGNKVGTAVSRLSNVQREVIHVKDNVGATEERVAQSEGV